MDDQHGFGAVLRRERQRHGIEIATLAARAGLAPELVERIEAAQHDVCLSEIVRLCDARGVSVGGMLDAAVGS